MDNDLQKNQSGAMLKVENLTKVYQSGSSELKVLSELNFEIKKGEAVCLLGASGAGKSTLLQILGTLDRPTVGRVLFQDQDVFSMSEEEIAKFRNEKMGFVFQFHHLIQELTALENVMLPALIAGESKSKLEGEALQWLDYMGLKERASHYPNQLSGGELQRVAIARALIRKPEILFADEPTGNLDLANSQKIQDLFFDLRNRLGITLVVVTHDLNFASKFPRVFKVKDGRFA